MAPPINLRVLILISFLILTSYSHGQSTLLIYSNKGDVIGKIKHEDRVKYKLLGNDTTYRGYISLDTASTNKTHIWTGENRVLMDSISVLDSRSFSLIIASTVFGIAFEATSGYLIITGAENIIYGAHPSLNDAAIVVIGALSGYVGYFILNKRNNAIYNRHQGDLLIYEKDT